jgi:hypothetical protein
MCRVLIKTTENVTANLEADRIEENGDFFFVYNGPEIVGVFDMGIVQFIYKTKSKD